MTTNKHSKAGRKRKFNEPTMKLQHIIPVAWYADFIAWYKEKMSKQ